MCARSTSRWSSSSTHVPPTSSMCTARAAWRSRRGRACRSGPAGSARPSASACGSHISSVAPSELERTSTGASSGPVTMWWTGSSVASRARSTRMAAAPVSGSASPRFARMRSASTSRASSEVRSQARGGAGGGQQVAQRPPLAVPGAGARARAPAPSRRAASRRAPGACCAQPSAEIAATGLCLCGIEVEPPPRPSRTSPTSVWREQGDVARGLADRAGGDAERARELADAAAQRVPRDDGLVEPERRRANAWSGAERADRAAELRREPHAVKAGGGLVEPDHPARGLQPERRRLACWSSVRPMIGVSRCVVRQASRRRRRRRAGRRAAAPARAWSRASPRCRPRPGSSRRGAPGASVRALSAFTTAPGGVADLGRAGADRVDVEAVDVARGGDLARACSTVIAPARACARASAASKSSSAAARRGRRPARRRRRARARPRRRQSLKKTVSPSPCTCTSKR